MPDLVMSARVTARGLDVRLAVPAGRVLAVLGPNGAGKSTTAAVLAGLLTADEAVVRVGERTLSDTARGVQVPPWQRRVSLLLQDPMLFPHLSVLGNVVFAARRVRGRAAARAAALGWLEELGVAELAARRPAQLSGGQAQRVAVARALAAEPDVLVLDEPLAGLDVGAAASVRTVLRSVTTGDRPTVLITHDVLDVLALADRVAVLDGGTVVEEGSVSEVLAAPRSSFAARVAGLNLIPGLITGSGVLSDAEGRQWHGTGAQAPGPGEPGVAVFPPSAVSVYLDRPTGSPRNCVRRRIAMVEATGTAIRLRTDPGSDPAGLAADVTAEAVADLGLTVGQWVWLSVKAQSVGLHTASRATVRSPGN